MAQMAKGGIIMDVTNAEEARIAEEAGVTLLHTKFYFCCLHCKYFICIYRIFLCIIQLRYNMTLCF